MRKYFLLLAGGLLLHGYAFNQNITHFDKGTGEYAHMLQQLEHNLLQYHEKKTVQLGGKERVAFLTWIRDHIHVTKAMKFISSDLTSFLEWFLQNQTPEGLYYDYVMPLGYGGAGSRKKLFDKKYWKEFPEDSVEMHRLPVEADLEYLMVEGVYAVWQATGDTAFIKKWLPALVKGMHYSMSDPLRWSAKYKLVKRGYTLDTWDFMQLPYSRDEFKRRGGNIQKAIFDISDKTPMGIMHGDNSGMYAACCQLAAMYAAIGNATQLRYWQQQATGFRSRTNALCWNGKFYAHFIEDDPMPSYVQIDQKNTLSLSNPYDINRGLPTEAMVQSIIGTYADLRERNKATSMAEWYSIYPAVQPHFSGYKPGSYMNGGVNTIVAGELAKAALQHGYETYGIDILHRLLLLMKQYNGDLPVAFTPEGKVDEGIPDSWGQAAVYSALIEGLAGVTDKSIQFRNIDISPRWMAAGKDTAEVTIAYGPSHAAVHYRYLHQPAQKQITLTIESPADQCTVRLLLPPDVQKAHALINNKPAPASIEKIRASRYVIVKAGAASKCLIQVRYQ